MIFALSSLCIKLSTSDELSCQKLCKRLLWSSAFVRNGSERSLLIIRFRISDANVVETNQWFNCAGWETQFASRLGNIKSFTVFNEHHLNFANILISSSNITNNHSSKMQARPNNINNNSSNRIRKHHHLSVYRGPWHSIRWKFWWERCKIQSVVCRFEVKSCF